MALDCRPRCPAGRWQHHPPGRASPAEWREEKQEAFALDRGCAFLYPHILRQRRCVDREEAKRLLEPIPVYLTEIEAHAARSQLACTAQQGSARESWF